MRLKDRVAIVTGAGQGIGKAFAKRFLEEGATVVIAELSTERGEAAAKELAGLGEVAFIPTDISSPASAEACAERTRREFRRIDILLNNAALFYDIDHADHSYEYLQRVTAVNQHGAWLMSRAVAPAMVEQACGRIINQASTAAYIYTDFMSGPEFQGVFSYAYGITKWGIVGLTKFLAGQLGKYGITVNAIAPGPTMTEALRKAVPDVRILEALKAATPMHAVFEPEDMTGAAVFFASDDARWITGQVLCVDGGMCMPA